MNIPSVKRAGAALRVLPSLCLCAALIALTGCRHEKKGGDEVDVSPAAASALVRAQDAFRNAQFAAALSLLESAERDETGDDAFLADVYFLRARLFGALNRGDSARAAYERVLQLDPKYEGVRVNLGNAAFRDDRFTEALRFYRSEFDLHGDPKMLVYIGRSYAELGVADSARISYEKAIESDASLAEAHVRLAQLLESGGDPNGALPHAQRAVDLEPQNAGYLYLVGRLLLATGDARAALEHLERVAEQRPSDHEVQYNLGQALARLGESGRAAVHLAAADSLRKIDSELNEWETLTTLHPDRPAVWATYGYALMTANRYEEAARAFSAGLYLDPQNADIRFMLANLKLKQGEFEAALQHFDSILQQDSTRVDAWVNAGIAHARAGNPAGARSAWERALSIQPNHSVARSYLAGLAAQP